MNSTGTPVSAVKTEVPAVTPEAKNEQALIGKPQESGCNGSRTR